MGSTQKKHKSKSVRAGKRPSSAIATGILRKSQLPYLLLFAFGFLINSSSLWNEYAVDDSIVITENKFTKQGLEGIDEILTTDAFEGFFGERGSRLVAGGRYRPLSIVTFAIEYEIFGLNAAISHLINILLYVITAMLIYWALCFFSHESKVWWQSFAFLSALFFLFHPLHTEAVANIKGRDEIMGMLFAVLALGAALKYARTTAFKWLVVASGALFLALFSKENPITFLAVIPVAIFVEKGFQPKKLLAVLGVLIVPTVIYLLCRNSFTDSSVTDVSAEVLNNPFVGVSTADRLATVFYTMIEYMRLLIWPHPLTHDYFYNQVPIVNWLNLQSILGLIVSLFLVGTGAYLTYHRKLSGFAILYYFITLSVVSNLFFTVGITMSERFLFMPSLGFAILLALAFVKCFNLANGNTRYSKLALALLVVILVGYGTKTFTRSFDWKNNFVLFTNDVQYSPNSAKLRTAAGGELVAYADKPENKSIKDSLLREAIGHLDKAVEIYPSHSNAWLLKGNAVYKLNKNVDEALRIYKTSLGYRKNYYDANFNIGCVLSEDEQHAEAIPYYKKAIKSKPERTESYYNLAAAYQELAKFDSSLIYYAKVAEMDPTNHSAVYKQGVILGKELSKVKEAIPFLTKAVKMAPDHLVYNEDLGVAYGFLGEHQKAIKAFERVVKIAPKHANAYMNMAISYRHIGDNQKFEELMSKARQLQAASATKR